MSDADHSAPRRASAGPAAIRARFTSTRFGAIVWRTGVTIVGGGIIVLGVILLPLPGPGWLIIFAGLGLLATEYQWAARLLRAARRRVAGWTSWVGRQPRLLQAALGLAGLVVVGALVAAAWWWYAGRH